MVPLSAHLLGLREVDVETYERKLANYFISRGPHGISHLFLMCLAQALGFVPRLQPACSDV